MEKRINLTSTPSINVTIRRPDDQNKVRLAIGLRRIDPADVPISAQPAPAATQLARTSSQILSQSSQGATSSQGSAGPSQKKRKAQWEAQFGSTSTHALSSQPTSAPVPAPLRQIIAPTSAQIAEDEAQGVEDTGPDEPIEELLCETKVKVVGIQYYKGNHIWSWFSTMCSN